MGGSLLGVRGLTRAGALLLGITAIGLVAARVGSPVAWEPAIVSGITLGIAMRWPLIMPKTGARVVLLTGLLFEALWHHGLATAMVLQLIDLGTRMVALPHGQGYWQWFRPPVLLLSMLGAYGASLLLGDGGLPTPHSLLPRTDAAAFIQAYVFWALLSASWTLIMSPAHGRSRFGEFRLRMNTTWWVPITFPLVAWPFSALALLPIRLEVLTCILVLWLHSRIGLVFSALYQDRAVAELVRLSVQQSPEQRALLHRAFATAHALARELQLPDDQVRQIGYAALLQDHLPEPDTRVPLWLPRPPEGEQLAVIRQHLAEATRRVFRVGTLEDVARMIEQRFTAYDGTGYPELSGDRILVGAQVLSAANAIVTLTERPGPTYRNPGRAVEWLSRHADSRFGPEILVGMANAFVEHRFATQTAGALPDTVRRLQNLVAHGDQSSPFVRGLRRIWHLLRGETGLAPGLPSEVLAVAQMASHFAATTSVAETSRAAVEAIGKLLSAKVALAMSDPNGSEVSLVWRATYGMSQLDLTGRPLLVQGGFLSRCVLDQEPVQVPDLVEVNTILGREIAAVEGIRSLLCVPLVGRRRTMGAMIIGTPHYHWFTPREVGLVQLMAGQVAVALENADLRGQLEERLEHISSLKAFTDTLLDNLTTSIVVVDPEGRLLLANATARALFASAGPLVPGEPLPEQLMEPCPATAPLSGQTLMDIDVQWGEAILEVQAAPLRDGHSRLLGAVCLARDVTQIRAMEHQVRRIERLAAMGELAAGAAHEIRNPLTSIRGFIQLIQTRTEATAQEYIQIVLSEIDRIDVIIRDLLLLSKPSDLQRTDVVLPYLLEELLLLRQGELEQRRIQVIREFDPAVGVVSLDPRMTRQLLLNLVINATESMPDGGRLTLAVRRGEPGFVVLEVQDTGEGIPPGNLKRLFDPFFTTKESGTGLGLALSYSIVRAHQGRIDVQSAVGQGTTFTVTLPVA